MKKTCIADDDERHCEDRQRRLHQAVDTAGEPMVHAQDAEGEPGPDQGEAEQEAVLHADAPGHPLQQPIAIPELVDGIGAAAEAEPDELRPDHDEQRAADRVDEVQVPEERSVHEGEPHQERAQRSEHEAGDQEEEVGLVDEHQPQRPPAVPERGELRLSLSRMEGDRQLPDLEAAPGRPDHHLGGKLHPRRPETEHGQDVAPERPQAAPRVANGRPEEQIEEARHQRIPDPAQRRHRARLDRAHPVSHHELGAVVQLADEARNLLEVVREVGIDHHDVVAAGRPRSRRDRRCRSRGEAPPRPARRRAAQESRCRRPSRCRPPRPRRRVRARRGPGAPPRRTGRCCRPRSGKGSRLTPKRCPERLSVRRSERTLTATVET